MITALLIFFALVLEYVYDPISHMKNTTVISITFEKYKTLVKKYIYDKFPEPNQKQKDFIKETLRKKINNQTPINPMDFCAKGNSIVNNTDVSTGISDN